MDSRTRRLNEVMKAYDSKLMVKRNSKGVINVYRERAIADSFQHERITYVYVKPVYDLIVSLTDNWSDDGRPVDWGVEPLLAKFRQMDSWRDDTGYAKFCESRERYERDQERMRKNEIRARAADLRKDFAKATNDIVVKQESLDRRRNY